MADDRPPNSDQQENGRTKQNVAGQAPAPSQVIVPVKVQAGDGKERWIDYPCQNPEHGFLSEVLNEVRQIFLLDDTTQVRICTSANTTFLEPNVPLSSVISSLGEGDHLVIHIEMVKKTEPESDGNGSTSVDPIEAVDKIRQVVNEFAKGESTGEVKTSFTIEKKDRVIFANNDQIFINQHLLHVLKEHIERPLMIECTFLFLGVTLGAITSILIALADEKLSPVTLGMFKGALFPCVGMLLILVIVLYFMKAERKKVLRPIIEQLAASEPQLTKKGKVR